MKKRITHADFIEWMTEHAPRHTLIGQYINSGEKITLRHDCGFEFEANPSQFKNKIKNGKICCSKCSGNYQPTHEEFVEWMTEHAPKHTVLGTYTKSSDAIKFRHDCGFEFETTPGSVVAYIKKGKPCCLECSGLRQITHEEFVEWMAEHAPEHEVLSEYKNAYTPVTFKHSCGHEFTCKPSSFKPEILEGRPCCAGCNRTGHNTGPQVKSHEDFVQWMTEHAPDHKVIGTYAGSEETIEFEHKCGHRLFSAPHSFKQDIMAGHTRCSKCSGNYQPTHEEFVEWMTEHAPRHTVIGTYVRVHDKIEFKHDCGHHYKAEPNSIKRRVVLGEICCPACSEKHQHEHDEFVEIMAVNQPDIKVNGIFTNSITSIEFEHTCGYKWDGIPSNVKLGRSGCPKCGNKNLTENMFVGMMKSKLDVEIVEQYSPEFVGRMKYDLHVPAYNTIIEIHGIQHYQYTEYFHRSDEGFKAQLEADNLKRSLSYENGITQIDVSYLFFNYRMPEVELNRVIDEIIELMVSISTTKTHRYIHYQPKI